MSKAPNKKKKPANTANASQKKEVKKTSDPAEKQEAAKTAPKQEPKKKPAPEETAEKPAEKKASPDTEDKEEPDALDSFLSRESKKSDKAPKKRKINPSVIVLIAGAVAIAILIFAAFRVNKKSQVKSDDADDLITLPAEIADTVDENGEHHVEVATDSDGEIAQNGYGELLSYVPKQITRIDVENTGGSFTILSSTPNDYDPTVYTLVGFEEYGLQSDIVASVANDAGSISFTTVIAVDGTPEDFGLASPRATVKVSYTDNTTVTFLVGSEADGGAGTYVALGGSTDVFLVSDDEVDSFLYNVLELINKSITPAAETVENSLPTLVELTGTRYASPITLVPNTDEAIRNYYRLTAPYEMFADDYESNSVTGNIRDLLAESVLCVNPSSSQLSAYGVAEPYVSVHAVYPDIEIDLACSAPNDDGLVNLYYPAKKIIYSYNVEALGWATTDLDKLLPMTVIQLNKSAVSRMVVTTGGASHTFDVTSTTTETEDSVVTVTEAKMDGKALPEDHFNVFFQDFNGMSNLGVADASGGSVIYEMKISYSTGRSDDSVAIYDTGASSCPVVMNGMVIGSVSKSYVAALQKDVTDLAAGKLPANL